MRIGTDNYSTIIESVYLHKNKFVCSYTPCYGLIKINNIILRTSSKEGELNSCDSWFTIKYITKNEFHLKIHDESLTEQQIYELLRV